MKKNKPLDNQDAGSMLNQKTNEDFNKKKPVPSDFTKSKSYQKDKIHAQPDSKNDQPGKKGEINTSKKTHEFTGEEFIAKK
ncbi:MAG: hypothetical protein ABI761_08600 [Saprospiraceae bacterium]